jgi:hypothetical protein
MMIKSRKVRKGASWRMMLRAMPQMSTTREVQQVVVLEIFLKYENV